MEKLTPRERSLVRSAEQSRFTKALVYNFWMQPGKVPAVVFGISQTLLIASITFAIYEYVDSDRESITPLLLIIFSIAILVIFTYMKLHFLVKGRRRSNVSSGYLTLYYTTEWSVLFLISLFGETCVRDKSMNLASCFASIHVLMFYPVLAVFLLILGCNSWFFWKGWALYPRT